MTGPYVVRHLEPAVGYDVTWGAEPIVERGARVVSVKAFETVEEAQDAAFEIVRASRDRAVSAAEALGLLAAAQRLWVAAYRPLQAADSLPAEGGKVELPDGSKIVVEATTWARLTGDLRLPSWHGDDEVDDYYGLVIAAWNRAATASSGEGDRA